MHSFCSCVGWLWIVSGWVDGVWWLIECGLLALDTPASELILSFLDVALLSSGAQ
jgi:hypothetical protein